MQSQVARICQSEKENKGGYCGELLGENSRSIYTFIYFLAFKTASNSSLFQARIVLKKLINTLQFIH